MADESAIREVLARIDAAWRNKAFDGLEHCFHEHAVIVGPGYTEYASGRDKCAGSYREFATNADVLDYSEDSHGLRMWETVAVYTFRWHMTYRRDAGPKQEQGTDQLVLQDGPEGWQVAWRYIHFEPSGDADT
jgi:ketosteroid isomerase-like protein